MIHSIKIVEFGCVKNAEVRLSPLHALIGPNDSGKSTVLRAIAALEEASRNGHLVEGTEIQAVLGDQSAYVVRPNAHDKPQEWHPPASATWSSVKKGAAPAGVRDQLVPVQWIRFDPDALRRSSELIADGRPVTLGERGEGLPGVVDAIVNRGDDTFAAIREEFIKRFPSVAKLKLRTPSSGTKALAVELHDGTEVRAERMSEGMLYWLAFAVLRSVTKPAIFLLEEPENGLHPARIADVVSMLRSITTGKSAAQIVIATHSPLVVNELKPEEVTVVTRERSTGTKLTPIAETPRFGERSKVYALGELWLSYANGLDEVALLESAE